MKKSSVKTKSRRSKKKATVKKLPVKAKSQAQLVEDIRTVLTITPKEGKEPLLVTPLPQQGVKNFGDMPFEAQARLIFNPFPIDSPEIVGDTRNSGAGDVPAFPEAKS